MFLLGHMVWAYVWAVAFAGRSWRELFVPAVLILAVLPDADLFLGGFGIEHHTFMHSLFFWFVLFVPFLVVYRRRSIPYFVALLQHFTFGDFVAGNVMLFWPFSFSYFGLNYMMMTEFDIDLEIVGLLLAAAIMYFNGDLKRLLSANPRNVLMVFPLLALVMSLFFAVDVPIVPFVSHIPNSRVLASIVISHVVLVIFFTVSTVQGFRRMCRREHIT